LDVDDVRNSFVNLVQDGSASNFKATEASPVTESHWGGNAVGEIGYPAANPTSNGWTGTAKSKIANLRTLTTLPPG
jgi:hypothetical protein